MWAEVGVAAVVGLALSDSWLCLFMGASFATADRRLGWGFLAGRTIGILALCLAIGLLGAGLLASKGALTVVFGISTLGVAMVIAVGAVRPSLLGGCGAVAAVDADEATFEDASERSGCSKDCEGCSGIKREEGEGVSCTHMPAWLLKLVRTRNPTAAGLTLGAVRGATPCLKVLIITPLLVSNPPGTVLLMALAFAATSIVYPLIGILSGRAIAPMVQHGKHLRIAGAVGVATVGAFTLWRWRGAECAAVGG